uniref:CSON007808 protein n=1 Tax=Culicoides sonorensis TaxID=179676 RepID=A0A336LXY1_CULSO
MHSNRSFCIILVIFSVIKFSNCAMAADELMIDNITVLMRPNDFFDANARIRRINKTTQIISGYWNIIEPFSDDYFGIFYVSKMDHGMWRRLSQRTFDKLCSLVADGGMAHDLFMTYFESLPKTCPIMPGNYTYGPIPVWRYRKDWDSAVKFIIPPIIPDADKWRIEMTYHHINDTEKVLQIGRIDTRVFNQFSAVM